MDADRLIAGMGDGMRLETRYGDVTVEVKTVGELCISTGRVVACDPGCLWDKPIPFKRSIPIGRYPVRVSLVYSSNGVPEIALASLWVGSTTPIRFEIAMRDRDDVRTLKQGHIFGHGVDSGTSSFMDLATAKALYRRRDRSDYDLFMDYLGGKLKRDSGSLRGWALIDVKAKLFERAPSGSGLGRRLRKWTDIDCDLKSDLHLIAFSSGAGDGFYASYWGYGDNGEVACLVTDFGLLVRPDPE
jgi:hypothetical protein